MTYMDAKMLLMRKLHYKINNVVIYNTKISNVYLMRM